jgi:putative membrane protein
MHAMSWLFDASICFGNGPPETAWGIGPAIVLPLLAVALLYAGGAGRLWRRSAHAHMAIGRQAALFGAGWVVLAAALVTPLHALSQRLFVAHMIEHELLMAVAAPLIAASAPGAAMMWALPHAGRRGLARLIGSRVVAGTWKFLSRPTMATLLHGTAIWIWHVPRLFDAALGQGILHYAQHASFLGTALLFWWVVLPHRKPGEDLGSSIMHLFLTSMHTSLLGVLLLLSPRLWYPANAGVAQLWGLTPLEDQQLAGLVMWVPAGLVYGGAALLVAGIWIRSSNRAWEGGPHAVRAR